MKIGYLTERLIKGFGMDLLIHYQANELVKLGHDVTVYTIYFDEFYKDRLYKVEILEKPYFSSDFLYGLGIKFNFLKKIDSWLSAIVNPMRTELRFISRNYKKLRNVENEVWISTMFPVHSILPFLKGKRLVIEGGTVNTEGMYLKQKISYLYQRYIDRIVFYLFTDRIVPFSNYLRLQIPLIYRRKISINYIGTDHYSSNYKEDKSEIQKLKQTLGITNSDKVMLCVSRINPYVQPYKGVLELINIHKKILQDHPNLKLIIAGFGTEEEKKDLEKECVNVIAIPAPSDESLYQLYDLCDFYVSATKWEGFNLPMIEAQSFGKIPIVYDIGPHPELINSGIDSFLVKTKEEFIDKIKFLYNNEEFINKNSEAAKNNAKRFSWKESAKGLLVIINRL